MANKVTLHDILRASNKGGEASMLLDDRKKKDVKKDLILARIDDLGNQSANVGALNKANGLDGY
jgi:hypothetical protein